MEAIAIRDLPIKVKAICPPSEWPQVYRDLLKQLGQSSGREHSLYTRILVAERETDLLFAYVAKTPSTIEQYYAYLAKSHREELIPIFQQRIAGKAKRVSNRRDYQDVCRMRSRLLRGLLLTRDLLHDISPLIGIALPSPIIGRFRGAET